MELLTQYVMLAIGIMFTPLSDDVLMITHLTVAPSGLALFITTWVVFTLAFSWFYVVGRGLHRVIPTSKRNSRYLNRAKALYEKHGSRIVLISYFIPGLRHPLHYVAGFTSLKFRTYAFYNAISAFLYTGAWFIVIRLAGDIPAFQQLQNWVLSL
ncbi:DedA family protein [Exiguobacterium aurantiacum]|uniref:VTT domain-containing protein n=1 Tax=Exiguobacterium aurantiacum TaxID=33987 RepID=A0ABY5FM29_9BACL|nr:VTT domain-containing protein [Exiguobacterium aurantiacum]UTT42535.1 VTT domain-containing protein [Exiguobacterium aurantiacum]